MSHNTLKRYLTFLNGVNRHYHSHHLRVSKMHPGLVHQITQNGKLGKRTSSGGEHYLQLMSFYCLIKTSSTGLFYMYPLLTRALEKLHRVIDEEMQNIGAHKITTPCLSSKLAWRKKGHWEELSHEMFQLQDRQKHIYCLALSNEENVTSLLADTFGVPYRRLPFKYYQIGRKFKDVSNPRDELLISREYETTDLYTFDKNVEDAKKTYKEVCDAYSEIFARLGLNSVPLSLEKTGDAIAHKYLLVSPWGDKTYHLCVQCGAYFNVEVEASQTCVHQECPNVFTEKRAIELGGAAQLGTSYSKPWKAGVFKNDVFQFLQMGHFAIGTTRLLAAALNLLSSEDSLRWPQLVAPHQICIVLQNDDTETNSSLANTLHEDLLTLPNLHNEVLLHDVEGLSVEEKVATAKSYGIPYLVVIRDMVPDPPKYELIDVCADTAEYYSRDDLVNQLSQIQTIIV